MEFHIEGLTEEQLKQSVTATASAMCLVDCLSDCVMLILCPID